MLITKQQQFKLKFASDALTLEAKLKIKFILQSFIVQIDNFGNIYEITYGYSANTI